jgi:hypothetical protein
VLAMAYGARCQHSDLLTDYGTRPAQRTLPAPTNGYIPVLARHGQQLLARHTP